MFLTINSLQTNIKTMSQNQLIKKFLASLISFESKGYVSNSSLQNTLNSFSSILQSDLQFPQQLGIRLLTTLVAQFRKVSKVHTSNQSNLLYQGSKQKGIEEYVILKYINVFQLILSKLQRTQKVADNQQLSQLFIVLIATIMEKLKTIQAEYLINSLNLLCSILEIAGESRKEKGLIQMIFPNVASNLFNLIVTFPIKSNKVAEIVFKLLGILIGKLFDKGDTVVQVNKIQLPRKKQQKADFKSICLQKIQEYFEIIVDNPHHFEKISSIKDFTTKLIKLKGLQNTLMLNHLYKLSYLLNQQQHLPKPNALCSAYLRSEAQKHLKFLSKNKDHYDSKLTKMYYNFSLKVIGSVQNITSHQIKHLYSILKPLFKLNNSLVKTSSSHNYSILIVHSQLILNNQIQTQLKSNIQMFSMQFLKNNLSLFQNQLYNQNPVQKHILSWNTFFCQQIVQYLVEDLVSNPYSTTMSVSSFKKYLQTIIMLKEFVSVLTNQILIQTIFQIIRKSDSMMLLQPSNEEEQFLIAFSYDIMRIAYQKLFLNTTSFDKLNLKIEFVETTISLFNIQNNTITTYCNYYLLKYSYPTSIGKFIYHLLPTLVYRNQYNILFIEKAIELCSSQITSIYAQHIYETYNAHSNVQKALLTILPSLSTQTLRKAILSITTKHKWIDALMLSLENLNNKPLSQQQSDSFNPNDSDNVKVTNCLGVVLIQIQSRFKVQLQNNSSKILDLFYKIFETNKRMIFCSKLYEYFPLFSKIVDCESVGKLTFNKIAMANKVLKLIQKYLQEYGEEKIDYILKQKGQFGKVMERLNECIEKKLELDETMKQILESCNKKIKDVCLQIFTLDAKRPLLQSKNYQ